MTRWEHGGILLCTSPPEAETSEGRPIHRSNRPMRTSAGTTSPRGFRPDLRPRWRLSTIVVVLAVTSLLPARAGEPGRIDPRHTHVLAVGACPPFGRVAPAVCRDSVQEMVAALVGAMGVPPQQVSTLLDAQADYPGVAGELRRLAQVSQAGDALIFYYIGHGSLIPVQEGDEGSGMDEVFCLWTPRPPFAAIYAVSAGLWMRDDELAKLLAQIPARDKLLIVDSCHSGETAQILCPGDCAVDYDTGQDALLAAAQRHQIALLSADRRMGLFTSELLRALDKGSPNLKAAFDIARQATRDASRKLCRRLGSCLIQSPTLSDPAGIVARFVFPGQRAP